MTTMCKSCPTIATSRRYVRIFAHLVSETGHWITIENSHIVKLSQFNFGNGHEWVI